MNDSRDSLTRTLQAWRVTPRPDPNFRPAVWQRIRQCSHQSWAEYLRSHLVGWSVAAAVTLAAAGWTGRAAAHARLDAGREAMVVNYLVELDPRVQAQLRP
jgi:hypothetical protein